MALKPISTGKSLREILQAINENFEYISSLVNGGEGASDYLPLSGGTITGTGLKITGSTNGYSVDATGYVKGSWLQTTSGNLSSSSDKICVLDSSGWVYYRTKAQLKSDLEVPTAYTLPTASSSTLGGVKSGGDVTISSGTITVNTVKSNAATGNVNYPIAVMSTNAAGEGDALYKNSGLIYNPNTNALTIGDITIDSSTRYIKADGDLYLSADGGNGSTEIYLDGQGDEIDIKAGTVYINTSPALAKKRVTLAQLRTFMADTSNEGKLIQLVQPSYTVNNLYCFNRSGSVVHIHAHNDIYEQRVFMTSRQSGIDWLVYTVSITSTTATITESLYQVNDDGTLGITPTQSTLTLTDSNCYFYILEQ